MPRILRFAAAAAMLLVFAFGGRSAEAQQANANLTPGQQVIVKYLLATANIPSGLQLAQVSPLNNVLVAAFAQSPSDVQKVIDRARLDGLEQDFRKTGSR